MMLKPFRLVGVLLSTLNSRLLTSEVVIHPIPNHSPSRQHSLAAPARLSPLARWFSLSLCLLAQFRLN